MNTDKEEYRVLIDKTWKELKDFQRQTVDYVYKKLYKDKRDKFLVADEVGLGKTIIAKGLIAKAFERFKPTKQNPTFNVIYICSNQVLAHENLKKLNFTKRAEVVDDPLNRLIYLAFKREKDNTLLKFDSLTPATSLTISNRSGSKYERAIIYGLLMHYTPFQSRKNGLKWLLKGGADHSNWANLINEYHLKRKEYFKPETFKKFREILFTTKVTSENMPRFHAYLNYREGVSFWDALMGLCRKIDYNNHKEFKFRNEVIVGLRHLLTRICLEFLNANLIILDEFQRYAEILGATAEEKISPAMELAQAVFELKNTKVLMLSATPFKPYSTTAEQEKTEGHYSELKRVLKFLLKKQTNEFWADFENDRRMFFSKISKPNETLQDISGAVKLKNRLQNRYNEAIVRTERIKVSDDQNALVKSSLVGPLPANASDIQDFISFDKLIQQLKEQGKDRITTPIEYSKSCPFPLSFLDGYQIKKHLEEMIDDEDFKKHLKESKSAWVNLDKVNNYKPLGNGKKDSEVPNAKMQLLINQLNQSESWKWLWVPPTINYYQPEKFYPEVANFSKTLIFSSWKIVPRAVATLLSYEAERQATTGYYKLSKGENNEPYFTDKEGGKKRKPTPILTFKMKAGTNIPAAMSLFTLLYPSKFLTELYDPEQNVFERKNVEEIIKDLAAVIKKEFYNLKINQLSSKKGISDRWYWCAPLLLDKYRFGDTVEFDKHFAEIIEHDLSIKTETYSLTGNNEKKHIRDLLSAFSNPENVGLGAIPADLFKVLALMCIGSPSICFLRSTTKQMKSTYEDVFKSAYYFGISKMHFFNKPEHITVVKTALAGKAENYWVTVLKYCLEGNIQSSLDEFIHLLTDAGYTLSEIQIFFSDVLSLRTATIKVDDLNSFIHRKTKKLRTHYAVDFGTQDMETDSGTGRVINMRQAFNSPYRPFVLASTSIGQEGLDFHYYCGKVMHWNLPGNAIDIEQREGRVNRYKGLVIRKNVAQKYQALIKPTRLKTHIWDALFTKALNAEGKAKGKCELVPYWHVEPKDDLKIERIIPLYPFSKDIQKYATLMETLTYYRLTFGQPRQEELVETLQQSGLTPKEIELLRKNLLIDLSPVK
jgi:hypothetical protein